MAESIIFAPKFPLLTVSKLETSEDIKNLELLMRQIPKQFVGISVDTIQRMRVHKTDITSKKETEPAAELIAIIGNYLVTSENGKRFISADSHIRHGILQSLPAEMFIPIEAEKMELVNGEYIPVK